MIEFFKKPMNKKGASSVLVILMMVVLTLFGLSALTASLATVRLTEKAGAWTKEFYLLEAQAEMSVAQLDSILYDAEVKAVEYMQKKEFLEIEGTVLPDDLQKLVYLNMTELLPKAARSIYLERVMEAVYILHAVTLIETRLPDASLEYLSDIFRHIIEDEAVAGVLFNLTVSEENEGTKKNIDIGIEIEFPGYSLELSGNEVSGIRFSGGSRYNIVEWREWQEAFGYSEDIQYADPIKD
ncbi:MAG: hypothetical protein JXN10_09025 [Clostridia bacterium]|nr:hypothetical protein [Clostridia bacterium]MBN2883661.1 hypothetical protein [Clostridia bacterium]